ncbi:hypothetical protein RDWZM_006127 [Blomia tropicalis]|uniref:Partial AB-hydrolase lipase domain-containing protein n=1 Tax=Blomia tropicalis TaxID=40697 RepID=A0A9Q0RN93_BLOTA|nr:hypothetical protein RDWZM_006127 [Blomia tropicalis]
MFRQLLITQIILVTILIVSSVDPEEKYTFSQLVQAHGYILQEHQLTTTDGYILMIHRVVTKSYTNNKEYCKNRKPLIINHGLGSASDNFFMNAQDDFRNNSIVGDNFGFGMLATGRYDVWAKKFWEITIDQMIKYDLPETIEYIRNKTGHKTVSFVGHSQGGAIMFGLLAERPEYSEIVKPFVSWAGAALVSNMQSPVKVVFPLIKNLQKIEGEVNFRTLLRPIFGDGLLSCRVNKLVEACNKVLNLLAGPSDLINKNRIIIYLQHFPSPVPLWQIYHYAQLYSSGKFQKFDYGRKENQIKYGQDEPPEYSLNKISPNSTIFLAYGMTDYLVTPDDAVRMISILKPILKKNLFVYKVPVDMFNHALFLFSYICKYIERVYSFWTNVNVNGPKPSIYQFGNVMTIFGHSDPHKNEIEMVQKYGKLYGVYTGMEPVLTIADADLIKQVLVKDFRLFINRRKSRVHHPLRSVSQFVAEDNDWKRLRSITSPTFTSGKLRNMQQMMTKCVNKFVAYLNHIHDTQGGIFNSRQTFVGFTLNVIASTSFATEIEANNDPNNPLVKNALQFDMISPFRAISAFAMPYWFNKLFKIQHMFNKEAIEYFVKLVVQILKNRKSGATSRRNDLVQLLMDAYTYEDDVKLHNDYERLTANILPDDEPSIDQSVNESKKSIQKLSEAEITGQKLNEAIGSNDMDPNSLEYFNIVTRLPYLEATIKETLRKYPPLARLERRLGIDSYELGGIHLQKDQLIEISTLGVHYNPEYYPMPEKFDPSRFMPENKDKLYDYAYIPFGEGPRNCVGMRFAYQEIKLCLATIVRRFRFVPIEQTPEKLIFNRYCFVLTTKPFFLKVEKR